ncbi:MAG TPA: MBL fold metallo-hydrolase [Conexibacter sp.]|jgi:glyoxylase-like metal-dependent hydrolase (beta-lactamase superfamily II)
MSAAPPTTGPIEVVPGVYAIDATFQGAPLLTYVAKGEGWTLLDAGINSTPQERIFPALRALGSDPSEIALLVNTHAHHDHRGGNATVLAASPGVTIAVPEREIGWAESSERYLRQSQDGAFPGVFIPTEAAQQRVRDLAGDDVVVDRGLVDGDTLDVGDGTTLHAIATPGHSPGHLAFHDRERSLLYAGDAIQGEGVQFEGRKWLFPCYSDVETYAASLARVEAVDAEIVCSAHYGVMGRADVRGLMATSRAFMGELDAHLGALLNRSGTLDLADAVAATLEAFPGYQDTVGVYTTVAAHLDHMVRRGSVRAAIVQRRKQWQQS